MLLPLFFPKNLLIFLKAVALTHGFNQFIPNLFKLFIFDLEYHDNSYNYAFETRGFESRATLLLIGSDISLILAIFIVIACVLLLKKYHR